MPVSNGPRSHSNLPPFVRWRVVSLVCLSLSPLITDRPIFENARIRVLPLPSGVLLNVKKCPCCSLSLTTWPPLRSRLSGRLDSSSYAATVLFSLLLVSSAPFSPRFTTFTRDYTVNHKGSRLSLPSAWALATRADFVCTIPDINKRQRYNRRDTTDTKVPREVTALRTPPREADRASSMHAHTHARTHITGREGGEWKQNNARWAKERGRERGMKERTRLRAVA